MKRKSVWSLGTSISGLAVSGLIGPALYGASAVAQVEAPMAAEQPAEGVAPDAAASAAAEAAPAPTSEAPASASTADAGQSESLIEEVLVTTQKRSENLQDVPIAVTALTGDSLSASAIDTQFSLPQITPNLQINSAANFVSPYLRGVGTQYANPGLESSVATYLDDQYLSRASGALFSFSDVDHIEVLKGPQGTLYGRNATGGAIRIISKDPSDHFEAKVSGTVGNYGHAAGEGMINAPLTPELSDRLVVQYDSNDGYVKNSNPTGERMQDRNQYVVRNKLLWTPSDKLKVKLTADYGRKQDHEGQAFINLDPSGPTQTGVAVGGTPSPGFYTFTGDITNGGGDSKKFDTKNGGAALRADYELEDVTLSSVTSFRSVKFSGLADLDSVDVPLLHARTVAEKTSDLSQEFQAVSSGEGPFKWLGGIFFLSEDTSDDFGIFGAGVGDNTFIGGKGKVSIHSLAPYGQISYEFTPQWEATLGARYTAESKKLLYNKLYMAGVSADGSGPDDNRTYYFTTPSETNSFQEFSPKAVLSYKPVAGVLVYGSVSRGFKSGGFNLPAPSSQTIDSVDPETLTAYEFGWKTQFDNLRFNGAAFYYDYKNLQVETTDSSGGGITNVRNAASATIKGVEADVSYALFRGFEVGAGGGYLDAKFDQFEGDTYVPAYTTQACQDSPAACVGYSVVSGDLSGNTLPMAPKFTGYLRANYTLSLGQGYGSVSFNPVYSYSTSYNYTSDGSVKEKSKGLLNASLSWTSEQGHYDVTLFGSNLTDVKYYESRTRFPSMGGWQVPAPPLEYGVKLTHTF
jgi:iron complex outermembrane receptor protein